MIQGTCLTDAITKLVEALVRLQPEVPGEGGREPSLPGAADDEAEEQHAEQPAECSSDSTKPVGNTSPSSSSSVSDSKPSVGEEGMDEYEDNTREKEEHANVVEATCNAGSNGGQTRQTQPEGVVGRGQAGSEMHEAKGRADDDRSGSKNDHRPSSSKTGGAASATAAAAAAAPHVDFWDKLR